MRQNFTENDLIRFYYGECSDDENICIQRALENDFKLKQQYEGLKQVTQMLDKFEKSPNDTSVEIIREHSDHFSSLETSS